MGDMEYVMDEGMGRPILVMHGGMGDLSSWEQVTDLLRDRFRTVRIHRRQYRLDVPRKVAMADEVAEVRAAARELDKPVLVGHSSGAVLALEALVADPGLYSAAVLYEPPLMTGEPLGGAKLVPAREAVAAGHAGTALAIFLREVVGINSLLVTAAKFGLNMRPGDAGARVERQLDDNDAINDLGNRLDAYAKVDIPVLLLGGDKSPRWLGERLDTLQRVLPRASRLTMHGQGHNAERTAPDRVAAAITRFMDE
jgi:pimeloyl-ACP methyl ester carboxylesterase